MSTGIFQLFVYGSLRSGFRTPAYQYLTRYFSLVGEGIVKGKLFEKGNYPVAVPTDEDKFILGELYRINEPAQFSWAIEQLDDYEGLNVEEGETPLYKRESVKVLVNGEESDTWIYWYNGDVEGRPEILTGDVLKYLQDKHKP